MAFFRNHSNATVSHSVLDENCQGQTVGRINSSVGNDDVDGNSSERDFDINMDVQDHSDAGGRLQNNATADDGNGPINLQSQPSARVAATAKWAKSHTRIKDKYWDSEDSEEEEEDDNNGDDLEASDDEDTFYRKKPKGRQRGKVERNVKNTKERRSVQVSARQKSGKASFEEEEYSMDSDSNSVEEFKNMSRRGEYLRKSKARSTLSTDVYGRDSDVRTFTRAVRKVSYVKSDPPDCNQQNWLIEPISRNNSYNMSQQ